MRKIAVCILFLTISHCIAAQSYVEIAKLYYTTTSLNHFENSDSTTRVKEIGLDVTFPIVIDPSRAVLTGLIYERIQTKLFADDPVETFSVIGTRVGLSINHSKRWTGTYMLIPKIASDFKSIDIKDFQIGGIVLMKYTKRENLNYKVGMYYNTELSGPFFAPLIGLYYSSPNQKFEANVMLPFLADVNYKLHRLLHVGVIFSGLVRSYHLTEVPTSSNGGYVVKATNEISGYLKFNLVKGLSILARMGYSLARSYRVYDITDKLTFSTVILKVGDNRQQLNTDFSNGLVYQTTLMYRFYQNK